MKSTKNQQGFSLIELLIVVAIIGIIAAIAIPNLLASRRAANEASAIANLRTLTSAQATYLTTYGGGASYASTMAALQNAGLIDSVLASSLKSGYTYNMTADTATATSPAAFTFTASPQSVAAISATGTRGFFVDTTGVIRFAAGTAATSTSGPLNSN